MRRSLWPLGVIGLLAFAIAFLQASDAAPPLGLPEVPIPEDNPQTQEKIVLGEKLFHDTRFSTTGEVSCATCHDEKKAFTDSERTASKRLSSKGSSRASATRNSVRSSIPSDSALWRDCSTIFSNRSAGS